MAQRSNVLTFGANFARLGRPWASKLDGQTHIDATGALTFCLCGAKSTDGQEQWGAPFPRCSWRPWSSALQKQNVIAPALPRRVCWSRFRRPAPPQAREKCPLIVCSPDSATPEVHQEAAGGCSVAAQCCPLSQDRRRLGISRCHEQQGGNHSADT